jgi:hypothetical protein
MLGKKTLDRNTRLKSFCISLFFRAFYYVHKTLKADEELFFLPIEHLTGKFCLYIEHLLRNAVLGLVLMLTSSLPCP